MRQQLDPCVSFMDIRERSSKFGMRRKVEVVGKERDQVKLGSQSESPYLRWTKKGG